MCVPYETARTSESETQAIGGKQQLLTPRHLMWQIAYAPSYIVCSILEHSELSVKQVHRSWQP